MPTPIANLSPKSPFSRTYSQQAVQEILQQAMAQKAAHEFTWAQLHEMASELNISSEILAAAEQTWQQQQQVQKKHDQRRRLHRQSLQIHALNYVMVSVLLIGIDLAVGGTLTWAFYPVLGWGLGVGMHALGISGPCGQGCSSRTATQQAGTKINTLDDQV